MSFRVFDSWQLAELHDRNRTDAPAPITAEDLAEFLRDPTRWRKPSVDIPALEAESLRTWMQNVYNELGIACEVPLPPVLTPRQQKSLKKFGLRLFFIPAITEDQYPVSFVKPVWGRYLTVSEIKHQPLPGRWLVVETLPKPNWDDPAGYPNDILAKALKLTKRFAVSWDDLHNEGGLLSRIAKITGLPKKSTRLPTTEEWNFLGNLFLWLNQHRNETLPDLGSTNSWEWTENVYGSGYRLIVGDREYGGLADVHSSLRNDHRENIAFRVLAVL